MPTLYLASRSKARKKILHLAGVHFKVIFTKIKERKKRTMGMSWTKLVQYNALAKAKAACKKIKKGIVVGADTIVVQKGRVFGKPKDFKEAERMLLSLSRSAHWIYSGIAVVDKESQKVELGCEKTKIYMDRLSLNEIRNYFKRTSPLDKAGAFDIQGRGAFFIRRIEGCFYNVVGLPLRRLRILLKKMKIDLLVLPFLFFSSGLTLLLSGCATEYNLATKSQEVYFYSTDKEVEMGRNIDRQIMKKYKLVDDILLQNRVQEIGKRIVEVCDRKEIDYHFRVIQEEEINAVALPGGYIYIFSGLLSKIENDDQLAAVLAHEIAHIVARHNIKRLQALTGYSIFQLGLAAVGKGSEVGITAEAIFTQLLLGYSREDELLADKLAARYLKKAGYNPLGMISLLEKIKEIERKKPLRPNHYFKTHPSITDRKRIVKMELGQQLDFTDIINMADDLRQR